MVDIIVMAVKFNASFFSHSTLPRHSHIHITSGNGGEQRQGDAIIVIVIAVTLEMNLLLAKAVMATGFRTVVVNQRTTVSEMMAARASHFSHCQHCCLLLLCPRLLVLLSPAHVQIAGAG